MKAPARIGDVTARCFKVPTDRAESDGTLTWSSTTLVLVEVHAGRTTGLGYTYGDAAISNLVSLLGRSIHGLDAMNVSAAFTAMASTARNDGNDGLTSMALSAIDVALWDLKAKLLGLPLVALLGAERPRVMAYGSGGFTSYNDAELADQLRGWVELGLTAVKMKVGREPEADLARVHHARQAIGERPALFVDANGAYSRQQALAFAQKFERAHVSWFEEPVVADDLEGLAFLCERAPAGMPIAVGEYGYTLGTFLRILQAGATQVLQADVTRCGGITGFLRVAALARAWHMPLSTHCAPSLHVAVACAAPGVVHIEYFHDHVRLERMLFDGVREPVGGFLSADVERPGLGLELNATHAEAFRVAAP